MSILIRFAQADDAALIADMSRQTFYDTFINDNTPEDMAKFLDEQFTHDALMKEVTTENNIFLLAYDNDKPVGYTRMRLKNIPPELGNSNAIEIARIYATIDSIGKGVGRSMMQACIDFAREKKYEVIWLGVWEKNERAIRFYTNWGFEKFADHDFILGNDVQTDWLMKKTLA